MWVYRFGSFVFVTFKSKKMNVYDIVEIILLSIMCVCNGYIVWATGKHKSTYEDCKNKLKKT